MTASRGDALPPVYLDHNATTPMDPRVRDAMLPWMGARFGNPSSSSHSFGRSAAEAVERARETLAAAIGARSGRVVFTGGATESDNLALFGAAEARQERGRYVVVGATEHAAVLDPARRLEERGARVTRLPVDRTGRADPGDLERVLEPGTVVVSFMAANNEVGTLHPVAELAAVARSRGVWLHSDAAQALGRIPVDVEAMGADLVSLSAHKIHGPQGVGALFVREEVARSLKPRILGGRHEGGLRSGTPNVAGIVGFAEAAAIASRELEQESARLASLRNRLFALLREELDGVERNGHPEHGLPSSLNVTFAGIDAEALVTALREEVALSTGSACMSARGESSHVLRAMGLSPEQARGSVRMGVGRFNTGEEIRRAGIRIVQEVRRLRGLTRRPRLA